MGEAREAGGALGCSWPFGQEMQARYPQLLVWRLPDGVCIVVSKIRGPLINSEFWLLSSQPLPFPQSCRSHQYSGWGEIKVNLFSSVSQAWGSQHSLCYHCACPTSPALRINHGLKGSLSWHWAVLPWGNASRLSETVLMHPNAFVFKFYVALCAGTSLLDSQVLLHGWLSKISVLWGGFG